MMSATVIGQIKPARPEAIGFDHRLGLLLPKAFAENVFEFRDDFAKFMFAEEIGKKALAEFEQELERTGDQLTIEDAVWQAISIIEKEAKENGKENPITKADRKLFRQMLEGVENVRPATP